MSKISSRKMAFLMTPNFALTSFSLAIEALSVANHLLKETAYDVYLYSAAGAFHSTVDDVKSKTVKSSNNIAIQVSDDITRCKTTNTLFICAYLGAETFYEVNTFKQIKMLCAQGARIASLSSGSFLLANMGLLKKKRCTVFNEQAVAFQEMHPDVILQNTIFTIDGKFLSCAGGTSTLDMMLYIIAQDYGREFAKKVSEVFIQDRVRSHDEIQHSQYYLSLREKSPLLAAAVEMMDNNLSPPISIETLCKSIGTTPRNLEKIFQRFFMASPKKYYLALRLKKALHLLEHTHISITLIAQSTGFSSHSYFSKSFKAQYHVSPQKVRSESKHLKT